MHDVSMSKAAGDRLGGVAALYLGSAYLVAIPYFLLVSDYPRAGGVEEQVAAIVADYPSLYAMHVVTYVLFGLVLGALVLALLARLHDEQPLLARIAAAVGMTWSVALALGGMVFTYGMGVVAELARTNPQQAAQLWRAIETVADGLGGAGGEMLGGAWMLLVGGLALRSRRLPAALAGFGLVIGLVGLATTVPALRAASVGFGLLQMVWFFLLSGVLLRSARTRPREA